MKRASLGHYLNPVVLLLLFGVIVQVLLSCVDVLFLPDVDPRQLKPVLNIVDWGSGYQALEPMREKTASEAFRKVLESVGPSLWVPRGDGDGCRGPSSARSSVS